MARRAPRREQVTVAELLGRSGGPRDEDRDQDRDQDTVVFARARHREKPPVLRSLARLRVMSVVAGALALTGGVSAAVSMPSSRDIAAAWPPIGLEPPAVALVPLPADVVVPPAKHAPPSAPADPESAVTPAEPDEISPAGVDSGPDSASPVGHRGSLARAVKIVDKVKSPPLAKAKAKPTSPEQTAPVRHEIPDVPLWAGGRPKTPDWPAMWAAHRPAGFPSGAHHGCGGGGRHRR
ncbi:hypothetical protein [Amycolatopsis sp. lyj-23]|uniref:hypothetical protein n=1 Tax=Amycolatopsis sp. lyj-23 TaxID=2789283 RepID=UPI0039796183